MPIVIDEVVISIEVNPATDTMLLPAPADGRQEREGLVAECVQRVLHILREERDGDTARRPLAQAGPV